jgi:GNAT superfamily N-acetyltransferase
MTSGTNYTIRLAAPEDAERLTQVHVKSWQSSYRGLLPQEFLDTLNAMERLALWRSALAHPETFGNFVAMAPGSGDIVGFCSVGRNRGSPAGYPGEVYALYLLEEVKGHGVGRALFLEALQWLREQGLLPVTLWVLKDNTRARRFYERMGGQLVGEQTITIGDQPYPEVAYGWGSPASPQAGSP